MAVRGGFRPTLFIFGIELSGSCSQINPIVSNLHGMKFIGRTEILIFAIWTLLKDIERLRPILEEVLSHISGSIYDEFCFDDYKYVSSA